MASPQKENGYTATANELVEAICNLEVGGACHRMLRFIERKTYGYNKKEDSISFTQFEKGTGLHRTTVNEALDTLVSMNVIVIDRTGYINKYRINKDYDLWGSRETPTSRENRQDSRENPTKTSRGTPTYKRQKQITKDSPISSELTSKEMNTYHPIDESGNPIRRRSSGKGKEIKARNAEYIKTGLLFEKLAEKSTGVKPTLDKAYFIIKNAKEKLGVDDFTGLFNYFFNDPKLQPEQKISLSFALSQAYINQWRVSQKNKVVSQVEASAEISL